MAEQLDDVVLRIPVRAGGPGGPGQRGRGPWYAWSFIGVLVAIIGLALLGDEPDNGTPLPSDAAVSASSSERDPGSPDPAEPAASEVPRPTLPDYPNLAIAGAPGIGLARPAGDDLELSAWWPGDVALKPVGVLRGALATSGPFFSVELSPDLRYGVTIGPTAREYDTLVVRLVGHDRVLWTTTLPVDDPLAPGPGPPPQWPGIVWSADSSTVVVAEGPNWTIIRIDGSDVATQGLRVGPDPDPTPDPGGDQASTFYPVAFSADGRWLYAASGHGSAPRSRPALRIDLAGSPARIESITRYPASGPDQLAPSRYPGSIDPATGRYTELVGSGPGDVDVALFDADGTRLAVPDELAGRNVGTAWLGDGRLFVLREVVTRSRWSLVVDWGVLESDGTRSPWQPVEGNLTGGSVIAGRSGFALFDLRAGAEETMVMMRVDDGATGTLRIPSTRPRTQTWVYMIEPRPSG